MPRTSLLCLAAIALLAAPVRAAGDGKAYTFAFTGDVLLARVVAAETRARQQVPWEALRPAPGTWDQLIGNFEGAVGVRPPARDGEPLCFDVRPEDLDRWGAPPFTAFSLENNHATDLGDDGKRQTKNFLLSRGIRPLSWEDSPCLLTAGDHRLALIAVNETGKERPRERALLLQKVRLARLLANVVAVDLHWGTELQNWPSARMIREAHAFIDNGADVIIGHHPHVIIPPAVYRQRPIFYSLGNCIFDQKYPATKEGLLALASIDAAGKVSFSSYRITTPDHSALPANLLRDESTDALLENARFPAERARLVFNGIDAILEPSTEPSEYFFRLSREGKQLWKSRALSILSVQAGTLRPRLDEKVLVVLEKHYSPLDSEIAPRPYVYQVTEHGLVALWRGSALAWPVIDLQLISGTDRDYLCVLHRGDSFLKPEPDTPQLRLAFYLWNGFGFTMTEDVPREIRDQASARWLLP